MQQGMYAEREIRTMRKPRNVLSVWAARMRRALQNAVRYGGGINRGDDMTRSKGAVSRGDGMPKAENAANRGTDIPRAEYTVNRGTDIPRAEYTVSRGGDRSETATTANRGGSAPGVQYAADRGSSTQRSESAAERVGSMSGTAPTANHGDRAGRTAFVKTESERRYGSYAAPNTASASRKKRLSARIPRAAEKAAETLLYALIGYFLGAAATPFGLYPCATAFLCAVGKPALYVCIGACVRAIGYPELSAAYFALNVLTLFVRAYISRNRFCEPIRERIFLSVGLSVTYGGIMTAIGGFHSVYLVRGAAYALTLPILTYCFCRMESEKKSKNLFADCVLCLSAGLLTYAARAVFIGKLYSALIAAPIFVLAAACSGPLYGLLFGLLCGVCTGTLPFAFALGTGGFFAGMTLGKRKTVMLPLFFLAFSAVTLAAVPVSAYYACISVLIGTLLYIPIAEYMPRIVPRLLLGYRRVRQPVPSRRLDGLSSALCSVSDMLYNVSDKLRYPDEEEVREQIHTVCDAFCEDCEMQDSCTERSLYASRSVEEIICARLCTGGLKITDLPENDPDGCARLSELVDCLNDGYAQLVAEKIKDNKTEILASEYNAMARLIKYTSQKSSADTTPDRELTEKITEALCHIGVRFSSVSAYGVREKIIDVYGVCITGFPCTAKEISVFLGEKCGFMLTEPEFLRSGNKTVMRLRRARKLKLEYARSIGAKGANTVSGDTVSFFENDEDRFYALISDGMGSGRSAALTSRLTAVFVEKLLTTGAHKNVTLELLNDLLLSKSDESFATVDLLEIDLLTGDASFIKAGAAPAYILRSAKLYKIASCTPPAGIIRSFNAENTKFILEPGDVVLMLSDGIIQSFDEVPWLCDMLSSDIAKEPSGLCSAVLAKAKKMNVRDDDMTCVAVKVEAVG